MSLCTILLLGVCLVSCRSGSEPVISEERSLMGTVVQIKVVPSNDMPTEQAIEAAFARISEIEDLMSVYKKESEISQLNREGKTLIAQDTRRVLSRALEISKLTGGAFDVTVGPLISVWKSAAKRGKLPTQEELKNALSRVGYGKIVLQDESDAVELGVADMSVDLGGIAKGYAADAAAALLRQFGCRDFLINAGGDLYAAGRRLDGDKWHVGIQDPRRPPPIGGVLGPYLTVSDCAVTTSGSYQQFSVIEGRRYSHIIDPRSGWPANAVPSVTVIAPDCAAADALATALSVLGVEEGLRVIESLPSCEALMIRNVDGKLECFQSSGFSSFLSQPLPQR